MANLKLKSVTPISKILVEVKLNYENGSYKMVELKEGQLIKNLVYVNAEGKEVTIDGIVKVIKTTEKVINTANDCEHSTESIFAKKVTPTAIVVDCSDVYASDIHVVPMDKIVDLAVDTAEDMIISDIKVVDATMVTFRSTSKPVCVMWNGELVEAVETVNDPGEYTFVARVMKKVNSLIMFNTSDREVFSVDGFVPEVERSAVVAEKTAAKTVELKDTYYNKSGSNKTLEASESFYTEVASGISDADEITVGELTFTKDQTIRLSVGNNSFIVAPAFKVEDGTLFVAVPVIFTSAEVDGDIKVTVNGYDFLIKAGIKYGKVLRAGEVYALGTINGYANEISKSVEGDVDVITHRREHGQSYIAFELFAGEEQIMRDTVCYTKTVENGKISYGLVPLEKLGTIDNVIGKARNYTGAPLEKAASGSYEYYVYIPSVGYGKFIVVFEDVVKA